MPSRKSFRLEELGFGWDEPGLVAGVDEAGRGPLAGPVVAAAVILDDLHHQLRQDTASRATDALAQILG